jgi:putative flippase GtrA
VLIVLLGLGHFHHPFKEFFMVQSYRQLLLQFIKFGLIGISNVLIGYLAYCLLLSFGLYYLFANVIAFCVATLNAFYWNNKYTFKKDGNKREKYIYMRFVKMFATYIFTGVVISNTLLFFFVDIFSISKYISPLLGLGITVPSNFLINKYWVFKG